MKPIHYNLGRLPIGCLIIVTVACLISILLIVNGTWIGFAGVGLALLLSSVQEGVYVDLKNKKYMKYHSVLWIKNTLKWYNIPAGSTICIRILKISRERSTARTYYGSYKESVTTNELYFLLPQPARVVLKRSDNLKTLYSDAQFLHQHLGFEIKVDNRIPKEKYL